MEPQIARYEPRGRPLTPHGGLSVSLSLTRSRLITPDHYKAPFHLAGGGGRYVSIPPLLPPHGAHSAVHTEDGEEIEGRDISLSPRLCFLYQPPLCNLWEWRM